MASSETIGSLIIGAGGLLFGMYQYFDKKRSQKVKIKVTFQNGMLTPVTEHTEAMLILKAANVGEKEVKINTPNILVKHGEGGTLFTQFGSYQRFPYDLKPGDSIHAWAEIVPIAKSLKGNGLSGKIKLVGYFTSQVGVEYKSKPYNLDVDSWIKD